ncbi:hypothetical protein [Halalkalicoccus tibetensis]|uniref:Twin-arginine translocation signal domain-containing protein n=1 Tax=Halalkalicoccus tibetensis TaxID=175632 RepID=A0ABD5V5L2_9EURY
MCDGRGLSRRGLLRVGAVGAMAATAGCSDLISGSGPLEDEEEEHTLTVFLEDAESGDPATEASVSVESEQFVPQADAQVPESDGIVSFELEDGEYVVLVESQEYTNVDEPVSIEGEDVEMTIALERGYG